MTHKHVNLSVLVFVAGSNEVLGDRCPSGHDHCQISQASAPIKWGWLLLCLMAWKSPSVCNAFYAARKCLYFNKNYLCFVISLNLPYIFITGN